MFSIKLSTLISVISFFVFILFVYGLYLRIDYLQIQRDKAINQNRALVSEITIQNQAIDDMRKKSDIYNQKIIEIQKQAQDILSQNNLKYAVLVKEKSPVDCVESTRWAVQKARALYK